MSNEEKKLKFSKTYQKNVEDNIRRNQERFKKFINAMRKQKSKMSDSNYFELYMAQAEMKLNSAFNCLVNSLYKGEIK